MLRIRLLLHSDQHHSYNQSLQRVCTLRKVVLWYCRDTDVHQQHHQPFHLLRQVSRVPERPATFTVENKSIFTTFISSDNSTDTAIGPDHISEL